MRKTIPVYAPLGKGGRLKCREQMVWIHDLTSATP
jgi:hypothetical protein